MKKTIKPHGLLLGLCALFAAYAQADPVVTQTTIDSNTKGNWVGTYGECYNVLPQGSPRTCFPEIEIGPDFISGAPEQYDNIKGDPPCEGDIEFEEAVCITGDATDNFDFRIFTDGAPDNVAYVWGFNEPGSGGPHEVAAGTSQENACMGQDGHSPDAVYASTFDSDRYSYDPLSTEITMTKGGDATLAFYFLSEADVCRSQNYVLKINGADVPGGTGTVDDISQGLYVVMDVTGIPDGATVRLDVTEATPSCGTATGEAFNSHLSGIFVDGTEACADPGDAGCTPGFWKNTRKHLPAWVGYAPGDLFSSVFEDAFSGKTLKQVLKAKGGGLNALGRHTVAALLNGANSDINYGMSDAEVIAAFNEVYPGTKAEYTALKNEFADDNERGCPINGKTAPSGS